MECFISYIIDFMNRFFQVLGIFFLFSCKSASKASLNDVIKSDCFWDRTGDNQVIGGLNSCYRFLPDGDCFFYYYSFKNKRITGAAYRYETDDVIVPTRWSVQGDTLLIARAVHYKVLAFTQNSITVVGFNNDTMVFRKNCSTILRK